MQANQKLFLHQYIYIKVYPQTAHIGATWIFVTLVLVSVGDTKMDQLVSYLLPASKCS